MARCNNSSDCSLSDLHHRTMHDSITLNNYIKHIIHKINNNNTRASKRTHQRVTFRNSKGDIIYITISRWQNGRSSRVVTEPVIAVLVYTPINTCMDKWCTVCRATCDTNVIDLSITAVQEENTVNQRLKHLISV